MISRHCSTKLSPVSIRPSVTLVMQLCLSPNQEQAEHLEHIKGSIQKQVGITTDHLPTAITQNCLDPWLLPTVILLLVGEVAVKMSPELAESRSVMQTP